MIDVPNVEFKFFFPRDIIAAADLCQASDAGLDVVPSHLFRGVEFEVFHQERTWPDQGHVALEHVPELWQLVQAELADQLAESADSLVVRHRTAVLSMG